jgi:ribosomal protein S17
MKIDIDQLTEAELIDLNHRIVERLRFLQQMRAHWEMLEFKIGDRVHLPASRPGST